MQYASIVRKCNGKFQMLKLHSFAAYPRKLGSCVPAAYGSSVDGNEARYSNARWIAGGTVFYGKGKSLEFVLID